MNLWIVILRIAVATAASLSHIQQQKSFILFVQKEVLRFHVAYIHACRLKSRSRFGNSSPNKWLKNVSTKCMMSLVFNTLITEWVHEATSGSMRSAEKPAGWGWHVHSMATPQSAITVSSVIVGILPHHCDDLWRVVTVEWWGRMPTITLLLSLTSCRL